MEGFERHRGETPPTRVHRTASGGLHLLFTPPEHVEIRNSQSRVAPGVDVRGEGGYVIVPPSPGYEVLADLPPVAVPCWLIRAAMPPPPPRSVLRAYEVGA